AQESVYALNTCFLPVEVAIGRRGEQGIAARGVRAEAGHHVVGRDYVPLVLGHLGAVLDHHSLSEKSRGRLVVMNKAEIAHEFGPEARVNQVQNGVLHAADVLIDWKPIINARCLEWLAAALRRGV